VGSEARVEPNLRGAGLGSETDGAGLCPAGHVAVEVTRELVRVPLDPSPPAANTRGATPRKGKAPVAGDRSTKVDKGKGKMVEPEKPKKTTYPIQTGGVFKIREPRRPSPPVFPVAPPKKSPLTEGTKTEAHPKVVRALKLADEELETEERVEAAPSLTPRNEAPADTQGVKVPYEGAPKEVAPDRVPVEESDVEVIEAPLIRRRKLKRASEPTPLKVEPVVPVTENVAPAANVAKVAGFLAARRNQAPPPSVP
jgi:hypothetical protein